MAPTNAIFTSDLASSTSPRREKIRFMPANGFIFENFGTKGCAVDLEADLGDVTDEAGHQERHEERNQHQNRLQKIDHEGAGGGDGIQTARRFRRPP